ncbi:hypothetical protein, partial [Pseudomonas syringae]|uniref:hypothetical protein n=1 Tax=Pseudomonas syringae TaxID=317 RepID=UPI001F23D726
ASRLALHTNSGEQEIRAFQASARRALICHCVTPLLRGLIAWDEIRVRSLIFLYTIVYAKAVPQDFNRV